MSENNNNQQQQSTTLADLKRPSVAESYGISLTDSNGFELVQRAAKMLASSTLVPKEYQNNISNCVIALNMSNRMGADPLMIMQNLVIIHGKPSWSSQFLIATVNTCGRFSALRYEFFGEVNTDGWGCRAWAIEKATGEKLVGTDVTIKIAKDESWYSKNGSKWKTIPQQMLMYRAGAWWARAYAPELSMGLHTEDEMRDIIDIDGAGNIIDNNQTTTSVRRKKVAPAQEVSDVPAKQETQPNIVDGVDQETGEVVEHSADDYNIITDIMNLFEHAKDSLKEENAAIYQSHIDSGFAGVSTDLLITMQKQLETFIK